MKSGAVILVHNSRNQNHLLIIICDRHSFIVFFLKQQLFDTNTLTKFVHLNWIDDTTFVARNSTAYLNDSVNTQAMEKFMKIIKQYRP